MSKSRERASSAAVNKQNGCTEEALAFDWAKFQSAFLITFPMLKSKLAGQKCPPLFLEYAPTSTPLKAVLGWDGTHVV